MVNETVLRELLVDESTVEDEERQVLIAKAVTMVCLFVVSMMCGTLPMLLARKVKYFQSTESVSIKSKRPIVALLAFGGGVLLSITFIHLLPEVMENIEILQEDGVLPDIEAYLGPLLMCSGFFLMYVIEELVHLYIHSREKSPDVIRRLSVISDRLAKDLKDTDENAPTKSTDVETSHGGGSHSHSFPVAGDLDEDKVVTFLRGLLIVLALSIHELFEGLAVGLESTTSSVWYMFGAIAAHKFVIAFCIGVEMLARRTSPLLTTIYVGTFSIVSAIGIGIGMLLVGGGGAISAGVTSVLLQGVATGTLLYVVFFEILSRDKSGVIQFLGSFVGFYLMYAITFILPHH